jgi:hypothetical protein
MPINKRIHYWNHWYLIVLNGISGKVNRDILAFAGILMAKPA